MAIRKFRGDRLFDGYRFREDVVLLVDETGTVLSVLPKDEAGEGVEYHAGIISPGMINCHCHTELSHMKGQVPEGTGLVPFVAQVMAGRFRPDEEIYAAIDQAVADMYASGIEAVGDICNTSYSFAAKQEGPLQWYNFLEVSGFDPALADTRFAAAKDLSVQLDTATRSAPAGSPDRPYAGSPGQPYAGSPGQPHAVNTGPTPVGTPGQPALWSIVPHSPYSVSDRLWDKILQEASGKRLSIHNQEDPAENEFFMNGEGAFSGLYEKMKLDISFYKIPGTSSIRAYLTRFAPQQPLLLVHNVHTSAGDLRWIDQLDQKPELYWCICAQANRYISGRLPDIPLLMGQGRTLVLGTDSLASNHRLDLLYEISLIRETYPAIDPEQLLTWATSNGAKALGMDDRLGSFEKGKRPGVLVLDNQLGSAERLI